MTRFFDKLKVTIAVQENTINQLQQLLDRQEQRIEELESNGAAETDWAGLAASAPDIFDWLSGCACGPVYGGEEEYALMTASSSKAMTEEETQIIVNWLRTASGMDRAELLLRMPKKVF